MTTDNAIGAANAQYSDEVWLYFLIIEHDALEEPIYLVKGTGAKELVVRGQTWIGAEFGLKLPKQEGGGSPRGQIQVPNVDRKITDTLRSIIGEVPARVTFDAALASTPDVVEYGPFRLKLSAVTWDVNLVTGTLGIGNLLSQQFPEGRMNNAEFPALFPG